VVAEAMHLPTGFEASIEGLEAGAQVTAADVTLPSGVDLAVEPDFVIAVITTAQVEAEPEAEGEEGAEAGAAPAEASAPATEE
jgi:large subunit ribosomal protein L25